MDKQIVQFPDTQLSDEPVNIPEGISLEDKVITVLRTVYDPEIPLNLYDLGLIYEINLEHNNRVVIKMTLTTPHCPVAESMPGRVESAVRKIPEINDVEVLLVWDPPWDQDRMSEEAKLTLGLI